MNRIKAERALKNVSQEKFAKEIGVDTSTVSRWESGGRINQENIIQMRNYFGCSIDWLLGLSDERIPINKSA